MRVFIVVVCLIALTGCSTKYATVDGKDISVKVRSIFVDIDYDSRVVKKTDTLKPLDDFEIISEYGGTELMKLYKFPDVIYQLSVDDEILIDNIYKNN